MLGLSGLNAAFARRVLVQSNSIPRLSNQVIEVSRPVISLTKGTVTLNYVGSGPEIDVYDPTTMESAPPAVPQRPVSAGLPIPANVSAVAEQSGGSVYLDVSWDVPQDAYGNAYTSLSYVVQYRLSAAGSAAAGPWTQLSFDNPTIAAGRASVATGTVPVGVELDVQVSSVATGATLSTGSTIVTVNTSLTAPGEPSGLAASGSSGAVSLSCTNPGGGNFASVQFYRNSVGSSFATASAIGQPIAGAAGGSSTYTDAVPAGSYDYFATAISSGGVASAPEGPVTGTAT